MPAILTGPRTLSPKMTMSPESGRTSPVTSFISDDLPQPDGPTTAANSPRRTLSVVPCNASTPPDRPVGERDVADVDGGGHGLPMLIVMPGLARAPTQRDVAPKLEAGQPVHDVAERSRHTLTASARRPAADTGW